jgi:3-hydroxyisobutyrate dehydrogenase
MKIAFIGLGNMGGGMAANLVKAGHEVRAFDLSAEAAERARGNGCEIVPTAGEAVQGVDAVVSMLPNGKIVESVYAGEVIGHAPTSALLLDCSTIDVATARKVGEAASAAGYDMVDAPVSGGIAAANAGTRADPLGHGQGGNPCRDQRSGAGGQDLQQHAARRLDDSDLRDLQAGRAAGS